MVVADGEDLEGPDAQAGAYPLQCVRLRNPRGADLDPVQPGRSDMAFLGHFPAQLGQQRAGGPTGTAHYQLDAEGADGLDYVVNLACFLVPVPLGAHEPGFVGKRLHFLDREHGAGHAFAQGACTRA